MHYFRSYGFAFNTPNWAANLLFIVVCMFIPVVGQIVVIGYFFEVIEHMHRRGSDSSYPDFNFGRFVKYLVRGIWPFLAEFLISMVLLPIFMVGYILVLFMWISVSEKKFPGEVATVVTVVVALVVFAVMLATALVRLPIYLKAGLEQEFMPAFSWRFFRDFYGRIGGTIMLTLLFEMVTAPFVILLGMLLCFVGVYPATALLAYSQHHLLYQLYQEYLRAGGTPIQLKPEEVEERDYGEEVLDDDSRVPE